MSENNGSSSRIEKIKEAIREMKANQPTQEERMAIYREYQNEFQKAIFYFTQKNFFIGNLLQEFNFKADESISSASLRYHKKRQSFEVLVNPYFFTKYLENLEQRIGVLHHEILHFTNQHFARFSELSSDDKEDHKRANCGADLAINQYITGLPDWCLHVRHFEDDKGIPFPVFQTAEIYYDLLKDNPGAMKKAKQKCKDEMKEKARSNQPGSEGSDICDEDGEPGEIDEHDWDNLTEEEKKQMAEEMKGMIKRTIEKTNYGKSQVPDSIKDLLQEIESFVQNLDYKNILLNAIKKHASSSDRAGTWHKPNKRYGNIAPGTTTAKQPKLIFYIDTSGSISTTELNQFLRVMDGFLQVGERKCEIALWHTSLYSKTKYKKGQVFQNDLLQSGGTDITEVINDINTVKPDLAIILTDGEYYSSMELKEQAIFIISEGGSIKHPMADKCKTIPLSGLKG